VLTRCHFLLGALSRNVTRPKVVLICHEPDPIDAEGLAAWLASSMELVGVVALRECPRVLRRRVAREVRRVGWLRFLDIVAFRLYYRLTHARADAAWTQAQLARLRTKYPADMSAARKLVVENPNTEAVRDFLRELGPDLVIARCKVILKPEIFKIPRVGTFVLHPGICPEYRNAHGCFWALVNRDLSRVGMTLLRVDEGIDTGPVFLHATYKFDELRESHAVIQYRAVLENLDAIANALIAACERRLQPLSIAGRRSATWGQPWLTAYWKWKSAARRAVQ